MTDMYLTWNLRRVSASAIALIAALAMLSCGSGGGSGGGDDGGGGAAALSASIATPSTAQIIYAFDALAFSGSASGGSGSYTYSWNFDSTTVGGGPTASSLQNVSKVFTSANTYVVELTVSDGSDTATATLEVTVQAEASPDQVSWTVTNVVNDTFAGPTSETITEGARNITATFDPQGGTDRTVIELASTSTDRGLFFRLGPSNSALPVTYSTYSSTAGPIFSGFLYAVDSAAPDYHLSTACTSDSDGNSVILNRYGRRMAGTFALRLYKYPAVCASYIDVTGTFNVARSEFNLTGGAKPITPITADGTGNLAFFIDEGAETTIAEGDAGVTIEAVYDTTLGHTIIHVIYNSGDVLDLVVDGSEAGPYRYYDRNIIVGSMGGYSTIYTPAGADEFGAPSWLPNDGSSAVSKCGTAVINITEYGAGAGDSIVGTFAIEGFQYPGAPTHTINCGNRKMIYGAFEAIRLEDDSALTEPE